MRILVDADACPVINQIESVASWHGIPVTLLHDTNHCLITSYSDIEIVGDGKDAVDYALIKHCNTGDVVITQDYGLAGMALAKGAYVVHSNGWQYTNDNIDNLITKKNYSMKKIFFSKSNHKRTLRDNNNFIECLDRILAYSRDEQGLL